MHAYGRIYSRKVSKCPFNDLFVASQNMQQLILMLKRKVVRYDDWELLSII